jgi:hypothetical protein
MNGTVFSMTTRYWKVLALHAVLATTGILCGVFAHADTILDKSVLVSVSSVPQVDALGLSAPGRWSVTLTDLAWPQVLQSLSFAISDLSGVLTSRTGAGTLMYEALTPTNLFANVYALPNAGVGLYHIHVAFTPSAPPVPLPAAVWLLLSGICGVASLRRKHTTVTNSVVQ